MSHIATNHVRRLLIEIKPDQDFAVAFADAVQNAAGYFLVLILYGVALGVGVVVSEDKGTLEVGVAAPFLNGFFDMASDLAPYYGTHVAHQPLRIAQVAATNGLGHIDKHIVDLIIEISRSQLPVKSGRPWKTPGTGLPFP